MRWRVIVILVLCAALGFALLGDGGAPPPEAPPGFGYPPGRITVEPAGRDVRLIHVREAVMGTEYAVEVYAPDEETARLADAAAWHVVARLEQTLSTWIPSSPLSRLNREAARRPFPVDPATFDLLRLARRMHRVSGGAFDPTVGPLLRLWKPLARLPEPPAPAAVERARDLVGFAGVLLDPETRTVRFRKPGMSLDLGGIAKGYAGDLAARAAEAAGARACRVNAGGDVVVSGPPPSDPRGFEVEIRDPRGSRLDALPGRAFRLARGAVATSGNYERYTEVAGRRYSHILDPRTGWPVESPVVQVTVIAQTGAEADALATALAVLGERDGLRLAERLPGVEALFLVREDGGLRPAATSGFPGSGR